MINKKENQPKYSQKNISKRNNNNDNNRLNENRYNKNIIEKEPKRGRSTRQKNSLSEISPMDIVL